MAEEQEHDWVQSCLLGDTRSFSYIVARYERMVRTMIGRMVHDDDQVEELAHQTFISAFENLAKYNGASKFSTWLSQIALNKARDHLRSRTRRERGKLDFDDFDVADEAPGLETALQARQNADILGRALQSMRETDREVIVLRYLYEHDYKTIADKIDCSENTAKVRCWRAVTVLRRDLERPGAELSRLDPAINLRDTGRWL
jgi:RNA polymerase sigma-70 factor (ECF subfamily)